MEVGILVELGEQDVIGIGGASERGVEEEGGSGGEDEVAESWAGTASGCQILQ